MSVNFSSSALKKLKKKNFLLFINTFSSVSTLNLFLFHIWFQCLNSVVGFCSGCLWGLAVTTPFLLCFAGFDWACGTLICESLLEALPEALLAHSLFKLKVLGLRVSHHSGRGAWTSTGKLSWGRYIFGEVLLPPHSKFWNRQFSLRSLGEGGNKVDYF